MHLVQGAISAAGQTSRWTQTAVLSFMTEFQIILMRLACRGVQGCLAYKAMAQANCNIGVLHLTSTPMQATWHLSVMVFHYETASWTSQSADHLVSLAKDIRLVYSLKAIAGSSGLVPERPPSVCMHHQTQCVPHDHPCLPPPHRLRGPNAPQPP